MSSYQDDPVVFDWDSRTCPPRLVAKGFRKAGWHEIIRTKGEKYAFQDTRPAIPRVNGIRGRGHCRVYEDAGLTIVACHGDTGIPHRRDPERTRITIERFDTEVYPHIMALIEARSVKRR